MSEGAVLGLFEGYGVELEYMIVDAVTLDVKPVCDSLMEAFGGGFEAEVERGECAWSNELARHVLEMKTNGPAPGLAGRAGMFQENIAAARELLASMGATLLPTGMHPWMDPDREFQLWPHEYGPIYRAYDRIFDCRGHGWSNLQSTHLNLPFRGDDEFGRLHAAIRLVLPLIPSLAASSPFRDGGATGFLDTRLEVYRTNSARVPQMTGAVIPERVYTRADYEEHLLGGIYDALRPLDPEGVLLEEFANSRGAIARFDRMAIEIRLIDIQECPRADLALLALVTAAVRGQVEQRWGKVEDQRAWDEHRLAEILRAGIRDADHAVIEDTAFLAAFGYPRRGRTYARDLWEHLVNEVLVEDPAWESEWKEPLELYLDRGCLSRRILDAVGEEPDSHALLRAYHRLERCLAEGWLLGSAQERAAAAELAVVGS